MGISPYEMILTVRARDQASDTINRLAMSANRLENAQQTLNAANIRGKIAQMSYSNEVLKAANTMDAKRVSSIRAQNSELLHSNAMLASQKAAKQAEISAANLTNARNATRQATLRQKQALERYAIVSGAVSGEEAKAARIRIAQAETEIKKLARVNSTRSAAIAKRRDEIIAMDQTVKANSGVIAANNDQIATIRKTTSARAATIAETRKQISAAENEIQSIRTANSDRTRQNTLMADEITKRQAVEKQLENTIRKHALYGEVASQAGYALSVFGAVTMAALNGASKAYEQYEQAASTTFTQVDDGGKTSLQNIRDYGDQIARSIAIPLEQVQPMLYDIFSSLEISGQQALTFGESMAKAAIGGSTTAEKALASTIGIMNAYKLVTEDSSETMANATKVNDFMFQVVRKGVGTYDQFSAAIGKGIPSAQRAGQEYETMGAMLAFLTRNGMTTAQAGTSVARAFDMISNPKFAENMKKYGMNVYDASGNLKEMPEIVEMIRGKLSGLNEEDQAKFMQDLKTGAGGTIQAMKFFDTAIKDTNQSIFGGKTLFQELVDNMKNTEDVALTAYETMKDTPEARMTLAMNAINLAIKDVGEAFFAIKLPIMEAIAAVASAFSALSPETQNMIVGFLAIAGGVAAVLGPILVMVGIFLQMGAALIAVTGSTTGLLGAFAAISGPIGIIIAVIAALIAIGYLLVTNWDTIKATAIGLWDGFIQGIQPLLEAFSFFVGYANDIWANVMPALKNAFDNIVGSIQVWGQMFTAFLIPAIDGFKEAIANIGPVLTVLGAVFAFVWTAITMIIQVAIGFFVGLGTVIANVFAGIIGGLTLFVSGFINVVTGFLNLLIGIFTLNFELIGSSIMQILGGLLTMVGGLFATMIGFVIGLVQGLVTGVINFFKYLYDVLVGHSIIPDMVNGIIKWIGQLPGKVMAFVVTLVSQFIAKASEWASTAGQKASELVIKVVSFIQQLPGKIMSAIASIAGQLAAKGSEWMNRLSSAVSSGWNAVQGFFNSIPGRITGALSGAASLLSGIGRKIIDGLYNGLKASWGKVTDFVGGIASWIRNNKGPISYDAVLLKPAGKAIMNGLNKALRGEFPELKGTIYTVNSMLTNIGDVTPGYSGLQTATVVGSNAGMSSSGITQNITVNTQEINPVKHAADLGWELAIRI